jgi:uncharacterized OB-fold protein
MARERVPFQEGLFSEEGQGALLAERCRSCGRVFFPRREFCPECSDKDLEPLELSGPARLYSHTRVMMPVHKYKPPFTLAWVEFPEKVRVMGQVKGDDRPLSIGMEMKLVIDTLWTEEDRRITGYKFQPLG